MKRFVIAVVLISLLSATTALASVGVFTPSVAVKEAPAVIKQSADDGQEYPALLEGADVKVGVDDGGIVITPLSEAATIADPVIAQAMSEAYQEMGQLETLEDMGVDMQTPLSQIDPALDVKDLAVRDLIDVTIGDEYMKVLAAEGTTLNITFDLGVESDQPLLVMTRCEGVGWAVVPPANVLNNGDGSVTVKFEELCPIAFLTTEAALEAAATEEPDVVSPETGYADTAPIWAAAALFLVLSIVSAAVALRKRAK